jgi:pyruvate dehydrogenase (quinone)
MAQTASDHLIEALTQWGVDTIFGLPGDGINGIMEALRKHQDKIRFVQVRHEEAAAFAACGYAKFTGRLGVCLATSGPGAIHLLNGLYDAKMDGAPVLALTGQQYSDLLGTQYQQEVDLLSLFKDVAAYNMQFQGPSDISNLVNSACRMALSKRTVAHLTFPIDYQVAEADEKYLAHHGGPPHSAGTADLDFVPGFYTGNGQFPRQGRALDSSDLPKPSMASLQHAAEILDAGKKVAILVGHGAIHARHEVEQLAELLAAPVAHALLGRTVLPDDHPHATGGVGLLGSATSDALMEGCDTLFMIGTNFPYPQHLPKPDQARGVQIDADETRIGLRFPVEVGLVGDSKSTLQALIPLLQRKTDRAFLEKIQKHKAGWLKGLEAEAARMDVPMKPQVVAHVLGQLADDDAIITGDSGTNTTWIARNFRARGNQMFSCSGNLATMAPGLPYAIGAQVAYPDRQVIAFVGDGGFTMLMGEMLTAVKHKLPIKVVVIKNDTLGQIKWEQIVFLGNPEYGVALQTADFAGWARCAGAEGFTLADPRQAHEVISQFLATPGPALLEAVVDPAEPPLPGKIKPEQAKKFATALLKGQPDGPRIAITAFRDKLTQMLA